MIEWTHETPAGPRRLRLTFDGADGHVELEARQGWQVIALFHVAAGGRFGVRWRKDLPSPPAALEREILLRIARALGGEHDLTVVVPGARE